MKITELDLTSITRYKQTHMDLPEKISVLLGHNAEGKTTVADAIALGLTGACDRTDRAGKGQENLVTTGEKQGAIKLTVSNNGAEPLEVTRYVPGELAIEGQHGGKTQLQANLCEYLGTDVGALSAALSTTAFIDASPNDQKKLLQGLMGLSFEREDLLDQILTQVVPSPVGMEASPFETAASDLLVAAPANCWTGEASTFDLLHKHVYQLRRDYKRDLKNLGEPEQPRLVDDAPPTAEIVELLEDLRGQRSELKAKEAENAANLKVLARLSTEIKVLEDQLADAGAPEAARAEHGEVVEKMYALENQMDTLREKATLIKATAIKFQEADKQCPMGSEETPVTCAMTKPKREKLVADLETQAEVYETTASDIESSHKQLCERHRELAELAEKPSRLAIEASINTKRSELADLPDSPVPVGPSAEALIATLTDRISEGERVLASANREEGARAEREKQQEKRAGLEQTVEVLEALVDVLSPSGLPGKILSQTIGPIEERANARLQELTGGRYSLQLVLDPDFAVFVDHDGIRTDLKRLSSSERQRVGIILQDAIVHLTGLRFLIVDNVDMLDAENRELLMDALLSMADDYDQIIVLSTIGPAGAHKPDPPIPDLAIYLLEDGQLREVE